LKNVQLLGPFGQTGDKLHTGGPRSNNPNTLIGQPGEIWFLWTPARILPVPSTAVEIFALEVLDTRDPRKLGQLEGPRGGDNPFCLDLIVAIRLYPPERRIIAPTQLHSLGLEKGLGVHVVLFRQRFGMLSYFVAICIFQCRNVVDILEHRHVDIRFDVTLHAWITVPVPTYGEKE
jgi:hypothetical protein